MPSSTMSPTCSGSRAGDRSNDELGVWGGGAVSGVRVAGRLRSDWKMRVRTAAGHSADMPTGVPSSSFRNVSVRPSTPYLEVEYMALLALGTMPFIDDVLTMCA